MITIPEGEGSTAERLPWLAIALALLTLAVLLWSHHGREESEAELAAWYQDSGLQELETNAYRSWLRLEGQLARQGRLEERLEADDSFGVFRLVAWDRRFAEAAPEEADRFWSTPEQEQWEALRGELEQRRDRLPESRFGLTPAEPAPGALVTMHLLNPSVLHWLVAMAVLLVFAASLEPALGRVRTLLLWLTTAVAAAAVAAVLLGDRQLPLFGSSLIASAMAGMYLGYFGTRRLSFLLPLPRSPGWQRRQLPAWLLAPWWLPLPAWALAADDTPAMILPQILALGAGALLVQLGRLPRVEALEEDAGEPDEREQQLRARLGAGWSALGAMAFVEAEQQFRAALETDPENFNALCGLYQVHKLRPDSETWRETADALLSLTPEDVAEQRQQELIRREVQALTSERDTGV